MQRYIINVLASLSVILNTLLGGSYRNTLSARAGCSFYFYNKSWAKIAVLIIDGIFFWDENHCYKEYRYEYG